MNPEFQRNLWLELTPRRMVVIAAVLALGFSAAALTNGVLFTPGGLARLFYYTIVVLWGARNAALSVIGEIRDRTWDGQRLSSLDAGTMMWGKLFGSTLYNWFGGLICLFVILADLVSNRGWATALIDLVYYLAVGVIAQAASLLASLIAAGRRQGRMRFEVFIYQAVGIAAGIAVYLVWASADPAGSILAHKAPTVFIVWWGHAFDARGFLLLSLAIFTGWTLTGCWRRMRLELKMRNGPLVWLGFLLFVGIYAAGFDDWLKDNGSLAHLDAVARRLGLAGAAYGVLAYVMVLLEQKDRVHYRWLGSTLAGLRLSEAFAGLQGWMMAYLAALVVGIGLFFWLGHASAPADQATVCAMMGLFTRDMAIVLLANALAKKHSGDFAALVVLFTLYVLLPPILKGMGYETGMALFFPRAIAPLWLSPAVAWAEAVVVFAAVCRMLGKVKERV